MADRFVMDEVRKDAIMSLNSSTHIIPPVEKIQLGRAFSYSPWVRDGFLELVCRNDYITEDESILLGIRSTIRCGAAREEYRRSHS